MVFLDKDGEEIRLNVIPQNLKGIQTFKFSDKSSPLQRATEYSFVELVMDDKKRRRIVYSQVTLKNESGHERKDDIYICDIETGSNLLRIKSQMLVYIDRGESMSNAKFVFISEEQSLWGCYINFNSLEVSETGRKSPGQKVDDFGDKDSGDLQEKIDVNASVAS